MVIGIADESGISSGLGFWITCGQCFGGHGIVVEMAGGT